MDTFWMLSSYVILFWLILVCMMFSAMNLPVYSCCRPKPLPIFCCWVRPAQITLVVGSHGQWRSLFHDNPAAGLLTKCNHDEYLQYINGSSLENDPRWSKSPSSEPRRFTGDSAILIKKLRSFHVQKQERFIVHWGWVRIQEPQDQYILLPIFSMKPSWTTILRAGRLR